MDVSNLTAEDVDWTDQTICYQREKLKNHEGREIKPPLIRFSDEVAAILQSLPQFGPLFPSLREVQSKDRANEFRQRCHGLGIKGVTLHSDRYAWVERARKAGYPKGRHTKKAVALKLCDEINTILSHYQGETGGAQIMPRPRKIKLTTFDE